MARKYRPAGTPEYTNCAPSREMAMEWRPMPRENTCPSGRVSANRVTPRSGAGLSCHAAKAARAAVAIASSATAIRRRHRQTDPAALRVSPSTASADRLSSTIRASPMSRSRRFTSRSRQRATSDRTGAGVDTGSAFQSSSWAMTAVRTSDVPSPWNARRPENIS